MSFFETLRTCFLTTSFTVYHFLPDSACLPTLVQSLVLSPATYSCIITYSFILFFLPYSFRSKIASYYDIMLYYANSLVIYN